MHHHKPGEIRLPFMFKAVDHQIGSYLQSRLAGEGLHFDHPRILFAVMKMAGASQKEIADKLRITPASLAVSLKRLEKGGYLKRTVDEKDLRVNKIELTEKGLVTIGLCKSHMKDLEKLLTAGFTPEELARLSADLERILDNLADAKPKGPKQPC